MLKHYRNLTNAQIDVTLFGVGRVVVPADAKCVPMESSTVAVLNKMAFPNVVLEEVEVTYTAVDNPVQDAVDAAGMPFKTGGVEDLMTVATSEVSSEHVPGEENVLDVSELDEIEDVDDGVEGMVNPVDAYTKAELVAMCEERGISYVARDSKADLYAKLF